MAGNMSIRRQRAAEDAIGYLVVNEDEIVAGVTDNLFPFLEEGEEEPDVRTPLRLATRKMEDSLDSMIRADKTDFEARLAHAKLREELDEAAQDVRGQLVNIRGVVAGLYGEKRAKEIVAIDGPTAQTAQPQLLWRQGEHTVERLEKETFKEPDKNTKSIAFDRKALLEELKPAVVRLKAAQNAVVIDRRRLQKVVRAKNKVFEAFDRSFRAYVRYGVGVSRIGGLDDLAKKLNTALLQARGRGTSEEEDEELLPPDSPEEPSSDEELTDDVSDSTAS